MTLKLSKQRNWKWNFNSHTREGVTGKGNFQDRRWRFQLTHPWGCDKSNTEIRYLVKYFNSHTREGVTLLPDVHSTVAFISTHTPVRVWPECLSFPPQVKIFQLTHPWGCDRRLYLCLFLLFISTHTPVRVWLKGGKRGTAYLYFNSHTREGVTL